MSILFPKIQEAVKAEFDYARQQNSKTNELPLTEIRKLGLCVYPLDVKNIENQGNGMLISFLASFTINDTYFRKGVSVELISEKCTGQGRVYDLQNNTIVIYTQLETEENLRELAFRIHYIHDDRTFKCMELGARLSLENEKLLQFQKEFSEPNSEFEPFNHPKLNQAQAHAAGAIINKNSTVAIQGPPGTGKTHLLAIAIQELVAQKKRVIISAPSNTAVDHLALKVVQHGIPILRVGNEEKIASELLPFTLDAYLEKGNQAKVIQHLEKSLRNAQQIADRSVRNYTKEAGDEKRQARKDLRELRNEIRQIKRSSEEELLQSIPVIAGTPVGIFNALSKDFEVDVLVLDEAGQCLAPLTWLLASFAKKIVICGDPQQLPPTVFSNDALRLGLGKSVLESVFEKGNTLLLTNQYRMSPEIVGAINPYFYQNKLDSADFLKSGTLLFIDMAGFGEGESQDEQSGSIYNTDEVEFISNFLELEGYSSKKTVVLSPYSAQIARLQQKLGAQWKVSTIDSIQGQEAPSIVISLTRSNPEGIIGFLKDYRRTNVAISRAQECCIIVGDSSTLGLDKFYTELIANCEREQRYKSAWEY